LDQSRLAAQSVLSRLRGIRIAGSSTTDRWRFTAGAGIEWGFARNWSAKIECLHYGLDSVTAAPTVLALNPVSTSVHIDTIKIGVNYLLIGVIRSVQNTSLCSFIVDDEGPGKVRGFFLPLFDL
jgi:hypothetical protein